MTVRDDHAGHVELNRAHWDDETAAVHGPLAHGHWSATEPHWGLCATPETQVSMLPDDVACMFAVVLGCIKTGDSGVAHKPQCGSVGIDISEKQLATARAMQAEFGVDFPLVLGDAERVPCKDDRFDLAISEYGASLWCDPYRWIPEATRLLAAGCWRSAGVPAPVTAVRALRAA